MRTKESPPQSAPGLDEPGQRTGVVLGTISALLPDGSPVVMVPGSSSQVPARLAIRTTRDRLELALTLQQPVVLQFENGDPNRPIVLGLIERVEDTGTSAVANGAQVVEVDVDGKRVRIVGKDEIVLQCGEASITLRRNGRVIVRGTYIETHSDGTNRIKGGQVLIN